MDKQYVIILAELTLRPECVAKALVVADKSHDLSMQEPGCELMLRTHKVGQRNTRVLSKIFTSKETHE